MLNLTNHKQSKVKPNVLSKSFATQAVESNKDGDLKLSGIKGRGLVGKNQATEISDD